MLDRSTVNIENEAEEISRAIYFESENIVTMIPEESLLQKDKFIECIQLRERIRHPNIPQFLGVIPDENGVPKWLMFENYNCTLLELLTPSSNFHILDITKQICLALLYLHSKDIVHGNLSPKTIVIGRGNVAKIGFVLKGRFLNNIGTKEDDIRALGKLIVQMCYKSPIETNMKTYKGILKQYPVFSKLLSSCFCPSPASAKDILEIVTSVLENHQPFIAIEKICPKTQKKKKKSK